MAWADEAVKIGLILPMTGQQASTGRQIDAAVRLYQQQNGTSAAGKKIDVILKDDGAVPDNTKRLAQELIVNDKVAVIAGFGVTPAALAAAPLATQAKVAEVVMAAGTSIITERSPYIVRTSFTLPQSSVIIADWAVKNGIKKVVSIVSDYAPGIDSETSFKERFTAGGASATEVSTVRAALLRAEAAAADALSQATVARARVSAALGLPLAALDGVTLPSAPQIAPLAPRHAPVVQPRQGRHHLRVGEVLAERGKNLRRRQRSFGRREAGEDLPFERPTRAPRAPSGRRCRDAHRRLQGLLQLSVVLRCCVQRVIQPRTGGPGRPPEPRRGTPSRCLGRKPRAPRRR